MTSMEGNWNSLWNNFTCLERRYYSKEQTWNYASMIEGKLQAGGRGLCVCAYAPFLIIAKRVTQHLLTEAKYNPHDLNMEEI